MQTYTMQRAMYSMQQIPCLVQHATCNIVHATCNVVHATYDWDCREGVPSLRAGGLTAASRAVATTKSAHAAGSLRCSACVGWTEQSCSRCTCSTALQLWAATANPQRSRRSMQQANPFIHTDDMAESRTAQGIQRATKLPSHLSVDHS